MLRFKLSLTTVLIINKLVNNLWELLPANISCFVLHNHIISGVLNILSMLRFKLSLTTVLIINKLVINLCDKDDVISSPELKGVNAESG